MGAIIFGLLVSLLIFNANASSKITGVALPRHNYICFVNNGSMTKISSGDKKGLDACQVATGDFRYQTGWISGNKTNTYQQMIEQLKNAGWISAETCVYATAVGSSPSKINIYGLGNTGSVSNNVSIAPGGFQEYCVVADITGANIQAGGFTVNQSTMQFTSVTVTGVDVTPYPLPDPTITVCRNGVEISIKQSERQSSDTDPPCVTATPTEIVCRDGVEIEILASERLSTDTYPPCEVPPNTEGPIAVTLNNSNTGPRSSQCPNGLRNASGTYGQRGGTLTINSNQVYSCYDVNNVVLQSGGRGATLRDSKVTGGGYTVNTNSGNNRNPEDFKLEYVRIDSTSNSKAILGGGFTLYRSHVSGGEDGIHLNATASTLIRESIIEEIKYPAGSHSDSVQLSSGGSGGTVTIEDSILQTGFRMQNASIQINVTNGTNYSRRNWIHGGAYHFLGDSGNRLVSEDDMFAYGTSQYGICGGISCTLTRPVWWSRQVRPRLTTPHQTLPGEAPNFPGNGSPASNANGYFTRDQNNG